MRVTVLREVCQGAAFLVNNWRLRLLLAHYVLILGFLNLWLATLWVYWTDRVLLQCFHYCGRLLRMVERLCWSFRYVIESWLSRILHAVSYGFWADELVANNRLLMLILCSCTTLQILLLLPGLDRLGVVWRLLPWNYSSHLDLHLLKIVDKFVLAFILDLTHLLTYLLLQRSIPLRLVSFKFTVDEDEGWLFLHCRWILTLLHMNSSHLTLSESTHCLIRRFRLL